MALPDSGPLTPPLPRSLKGLRSCEGQVESTHGKRSGTGGWGGEGVIVQWGQRFSLGRSWS